MKIIDIHPFVIFPIAFDDICGDMDALREIRRNSSRIVLYRRILDKHMQSIQDYIEKDKNNIGKKYYIVDLSYIDNAGDRIFERLSKYSNVMIINVGNFPALSKRIDEDLKLFLKRVEGWFSDKETYNVFLKNKEIIENVYKRIEVSIVNTYTKRMTIEDIKEAEPLPSSNVYSNMYIDTAQLFYNVENYRFMVFRLLCKIYEYEEHDFDRINGFISASSNGANLANIIGWLTGKKAIFCTDLGPKYSLTLKYFVDDIRPKKNYVYIFDFLCLGTEAKMLNAIVNVKNAKLLSGYGFASYSKNNEGILAKMHSIVNLKDEGFGFRITGDKEELKSILMGENKNEFKQYIHEV